MSAPLPSLRREAGLTLALAFPLIIGQLSQMAMGVIDTIMVGALGKVELAALSFATAVIGIPLIIGIGVMTSVSVLGAQSKGEENAERGQGVCASGFHLGIITGVLLSGLTIACFPLLQRMDQPADVLALAPPYLAIFLISLIPAFASMGLKNYTDSLNRPWPGFFIFFGGVLLNVPMNLLFIHGWGPVPGMGLVGAGWATLVCRIAILAAMIIWLRRSVTLRDWVPQSFWRIPAVFGRKVRALLKLGIPASAHLLAEGGAFSMAGFFMGAFGKTALASHQIAVTTSGTAFMIPLGVALAMTVRIGQIANTSDVTHKRRIAISGWIIIIGITAATCATFLIGRFFIAEVFVDESDVILLASKLLVIVALFQLVDGIQVGSTGLLRGLSDVTVPAWIAFSCYWGCGLTSGYALAHFGGLGATGIWWGLLIGLSLAAVVMSLRFWKVSARPNFGEKR